MSVKFALIKIVFGCFGGDFLTPVGNLHLLLLLLDKQSEHPHFLIAIYLKVEAELLPKSKLQQVVIKRFLTYTDLIGCIFDAPSLELQLTGLFVRHHDPVVEFAPGRYLLDDV